MTLTEQQKWIKAENKRLNTIWSSNDNKIYVVRRHTSSGEIYEVHHKRMLKK